MKEIICLPGLKRSYQSFIIVFLGTAGHMECIQFIYVKEDMVKNSQVKKINCYVLYMYVCVYIYTYIYI